VSRANGQPVAVALIARPTGSCKRCRRLGPAFLGGRHADPGLGIDEELSAKEEASGVEPPAGGDAGPSADGAVPASAASQDTTAPVPEEANTDRNAEVNFHGQKRSNETHVSRTDPQARLYRKGLARKPGSASWAMP
jgi:hypothetical protein